MGAAAAGAAVSTFTAWLGGTTTFAALAKVFVVSFLVNKAAAAFTRGSEDGSSAFDQGRTNTFRQSASPRKIIYGTTRVGGVYTYIGKSDKSRYLHFVITVSGHRCKALKGIHFDGDEAINSAGQPISKYQGERASGTFEAISSGKFRASNAAGNSESLSDFGSPSIIKVSGFSNAANNGFFRVTEVVLDTVSNYHELRVSSTLVDEGPTSGININADYAMVEKRLGDDDQSALTGLRRLTNQWTSDHRQRGCAHFHLVLRWHRNKFAAGAPNATIMVEGRDEIYDPSTGTYGYTENVALCLSDYITNTRWGLGADYDEEIDEAALIEAQNACDESVDKADGGTEKRYTCNGRISTAATPKENMGVIASAMAMNGPVYSGGRWVIHAGVYRPPIHSYDEDNVHGQLTVATKTSLGQTFNAVKGTYYGPDNRYQEAGFPPITNSFYEGQDQGERHWKNITLPLTDSPSMAQRIAKIELERARQPMQVSAPMDLSIIKSMAGDVIELSNDRFGFVNKPFEIQEWQFSVGTDGLLGSSVSLRETASSVYDWNDGEETQVDLAPDSELPDPGEVAAMTNLTVESGTEHLHVKKDGTIISRAFLQWETADEGFVREYEIQYKRSQDSKYQPAGRPDELDNSFYVTDLEDGVEYDFRGRAVSAFLSYSDWEYVLSHTVVGKTELPPKPDEFDVAVQADGTREFSFTLNDPPADLAGFEVRHIIGSSTDWDAMQKLTPQGRLVFSPFESNQIGPGLHSFGVKSVDTSGNYSEEALFIEQDLPNPRLAGVLLQRKEKRLNWPGTRNSMFRDTDNVLRAVAAADGTWGDLAGTTWGDAAGKTWFNWTNRESPVSYETEVMDLTIDAIFTPRVSVSYIGTITLEMKTGTDADGGVTGSYVALGSVEGARYVQIRATISGTTPELSSMTTLIDGDTEQTEREDIDTSSETAPWFNRIATGHFQIAANDSTGAVSSATIKAIQGITTRHWWSLESKQETVNGNPAAEFKVYDDTDTLTDVLIDVELKGPKKAE